MNKVALKAINNIKVKVNKYYATYENFVITIISRLLLIVSFFASIDGEFLLEFL